MDLGTTPRRSGLHDAGGPEAPDHDQRGEHATVAETPDSHGAYPRLSDEQIERLAAQGERRRDPPR